MFHGIVPKEGEIDGILPGARSEASKRKSDCTRHTKRLTHAFDNTGDRWECWGVLERTKEKQRNQL